MPQTQTVTATGFKAKCLGILDHLGSNGIIVTKRNRPVARVLPERAIVNEQFIGSMKDSIEINGEIGETGIVWDAQS